MTGEISPQPNPLTGPPSQPAPVPKPAEAQGAAGKPTITWEDFARLDIRIATIIEAADHPNADKLLVLQIDLGGGLRRQIIAGLRQHYAAADLVGKQVAVIANLAPRKMRGLESNGMLLAATDAGTDPLKVVVLTPASQVSPGSSVS